MTLKLNNKKILQKQGVFKNFIVDTGTNKIKIHLIDGTVVPFMFDLKKIALNISSNKLVIRRKFFNLFWSKLNFFFQTLKYGVFSELIIYGIGYHFFILKDYIRLDFGLSHFGLIKLPKFIDVYITKKQVLLNSFHLNDLELFLSKLLKFKRKINPYQLKGLFLKSNKLKVKVGKQKHI